MPCLMNNLYGGVDEVIKTLNNVVHYLGMGDNKNSMSRYIMRVIITIIDIITISV